jgi:nucleoside-diphosphate-sugar epimerase
MVDSPSLLAEPPVTILTGAAGWFGRAFLDAVGQGRTEGTGPVARSGTVRALVAHPQDVPEVLAVLPRAEVYVGDIADESVLARLFSGADGASLVHAAGVIHPRRAADFERVNHLGTVRVVEAASKVGVRRMVHVSSNSPFGTNARHDDAFRHDEPYQPYLGYGTSKMHAELAVRTAHEAGRLETTIVRPPWFYGPWQPTRQTTFFTLVRKGRFPIVGDGQQRRSMVFVDNLVQGVALAERHPAAPGNAFWVADERPYTVAEIVSTVKRALADEGLSVSSRQLHVPEAASRVAESVDRYLQRRGRYHQEMHVLGEMGKTIACDIATTADLLGYRPAWDLYAGMRQAVSWCRARGIEL